MMAEEWERSPSLSPTYDYSYDYHDPDGGGRDSPMDTEQEMLDDEEENHMKPSSSLQLMLSSICHERGKDHQSQQLISDGR